MDPDVTLEQIRELAATIMDADLTSLGLVELGDQLADAVSHLDVWLSEGGMLPAPWRFNDLRLHRNISGPVSDPAEWKHLP